MLELVTKNRILRITKKIINSIKISSNTSALILAPLDENNKNSFLVAQGFYQNILMAGGKANLLVYKPRLFENPMDEEVYRAISNENYNLIIQTGLDGVGHDPYGRVNPYKFNGTYFTNVLFYRRAKKEINAFWFYVKDINKWLNSCDINYDELGKNSLILQKNLNDAEKVKFYSGNNKYLLQFNLSKNYPIADYNFKQHLKGEGCNIPFGEVFTTPDLKSANGEILIDGSIYSELHEKTITVKNPIYIKFEKGKVTNIRGKSEARYLKKMLKIMLDRTIKIRKTNKLITKEYEENIFRIGEFAIGLNKKAKFCNDLLIDEKVYGTAHIALGSSYNGDPALIHCDMIVRKPKIILIDKQGKEKLIVENHKFQL